MGRFSLLDRDFSYTTEVLISSSQNEGAHFVNVADCRLPRPRRPSCDSRQCGHNRPGWKEPRVHEVGTLVPPGGQRQDQRLHSLHQNPRGQAQVDGGNQQGLGHCHAQVFSLVMNDLFIYQLLVLLFCFNIRVAAFIDEMGLHNIVAIYIVKNEKRPKIKGNQNGISLLGLSSRSFTNVIL